MWQRAFCFDCAPMVKTGTRANNPGIEAASSKSTANLRNAPPARDFPTMHSRIGLSPEAPSDCSLKLGRSSARQTHDKPL